MIVIGHLSIGMKEIGHHSLEMIGIDHHFQEMKEIFHFHPGEVGIVGHLLQGMKEDDGHHFLEKRWMSLAGQENVAHLVDLCLPHCEVEGQDHHSMRMREGDQYRHPHGHQQSITDGDGPPQDQTSEAGLHLLRNLTGLVILCHLLHVKQISLMSEGGHHLVTGIEEIVSTFQFAISLRYP